MSHYEFVIRIMVLVALILLIPGFIGLIAFSNSTYEEGILSRIVLSIWVLFSIDLFLLTILMIAPIVLGVKNV